VHFSASIFNIIETLVSSWSILLKGIFRTAFKTFRAHMKRPFDPIPEKIVVEDSVSEASKTSKREFPKRKVAMILGYSGTGYQGMQR
jgi:hypothetical protein